MYRVQLRVPQSLTSRLLDKIEHFNLLHCDILAYFVYFLDIVSVKSCDPTDIIKIQNENENENGNINDNEHDMKMIMKVDNDIYNDDGNSENSDNSDDNNDNDRDNADYINDGSRLNNIGANSQYENSNSKIYQIENKDKHQEVTIVGHNTSMYNDVYHCNINNEMW